MAVYPLLALLWAIVLVPPMVRRRVNDRAEFAEFDRMRLCFVGSASTASHQRNDTPSLPVRRSATQRRRRVLTLIGAGMIVTLVVALILRTRVAWGMHLLVYDVLIGYVGLLARARDKRADRREAAVLSGDSAAGDWAVGDWAAGDSAAGDWAVDDWTVDEFAVDDAPVRQLPRRTPVTAPPVELPELLRAASR